MSRFSRKSRKTGPVHTWLAWPLVALIWVVMGLAYRSKLPSDLEDICTIFEDRSDWYQAALKSEQRWGTPAHIQMAIIRQESSFRFNAKPPREKLLGIIPWKRPSNAYGFAQALDATWERYKRDTGRPYADRDSFFDAIDFVGWYTDLSKDAAGISKWDPYNQYLAYHEGQAGWQRGTWKNKNWLKKTAKRVDNRARQWSAQLNSCREDLDSRWWMVGI